MNAGHQDTNLFVGHAFSAAMSLRAGGDLALLGAQVSSQGFGYDPLFIDLASGTCVAGMDPAEKNRRSHRQAALQRLLVLLAGAD